MDAVHIQLDETTGTFGNIQTAKEIINQAFSVAEGDETTKGDIGALHTDEFIAAISSYYRDKAEWARLSLKLKKYQALTEVKRRVTLFFKIQNKNKKTYTSNTFNTTKAFKVSNPTLNLHQPNTKNPKIENGCLVTFDDETGKETLVIESEAALTLQQALNGFLAYEIGSDSWFRFFGNHWKALASEKMINTDVYELLYFATDGLGFRPSYASNIVTLLSGGNMLPLPEVDHKKIPFQNGLLDIDTRQLEAITPYNAQSWILPYEYQPSATCETTQAWLTTATDGDTETVEFLRAFMAATLHGMNELQKFLHLKGDGGTGKGTFLRLLKALIGAHNTVDTDLEQLEGNRFEAAMLFGKRLCIISDSDKYGGSVNKLKAITGQDFIRLERKNKQQSGGFIFPGLLVMASNEDLQTTDHTSAIDRRRLTVIFNRRATDEEKAYWESLGGEAAVLHTELPGLVNWLLELPNHKIRHIIRNPPKRIADANLRAMTASNPLADWLIEACYPDPQAWTQIGDSRKVTNQGVETVYVDADSSLYPNFMQWCQRGNKSPIALRRFRSLVIQTCTTLKADVHEVRRGAGMGITGVRLRKDWEKWPLSV